VYVAPLSLTGIRNPTQKRTTSALTLEENANRPQRYSKMSINRALVQRSDLLVTKDALRPRNQGDD
jgi:hypothetical protein